MSPRNLLLAMFLTPALASAQSASPASPPVVQDNSFLVEEAYNQETGIVQHIFTLLTHHGTSDFEGAFTQEWPVGSITHQLSYDLPIVRSESESGLGDVRINYRYQLRGNGETRVAVSPRLSATLPTGDWKKGRGSGSVGFETMLPVSYVISPLFTTHSNVGASYTPSARNEIGARANSFGVTLAQSLIITSSNFIQPLVEVVYTGEQSVIDEDKTEWSDDFVISPGVRVAFNFKSGLQIVPGIAVPIGVGPSRGDRGLFFYLSFEHPFVTAK
jgi:hypothetical protein